MTANTTIEDTPEIAPKTAREALTELGYAPEDSIDIFIEPQWSDQEIFGTAMSIWPLQADQWEFRAVHRPVIDAQRPGMLLIGATADSKLYTGEFSIGLISR